MKLIKVECIGPPGKRNYKKRFTVECPVCLSIVTRRGWSCLTAKSCGCVSNAAVKHGMAQKHPLYRVWHGMRGRCLSTGNPSFKHYGGRGITICPEWEDFKVFYDWAISAGWLPELFLDREDNDGNYTPDNCRFVTVLKSNRNKSNTITEAQAVAIHGLLDAGHPIHAIARILNIPRYTITNIKRRLCWLKEELCPT